MLIVSTDRAARIAELKSALASTRAAIRRITDGGQQYSAEGRSMMRADLRALRELEKDQADELARLERGRRGITYGVIHR